jgi:U3 small nucleolar RNA-associated protein MPP10
MPAVAEGEQLEEDGESSDSEELKNAEELEGTEDGEELEGTDDEEEMGDKEEEEAELDGRGGNGVEDEFLKIDELTEFLEKGEEEEYGDGAKRREKSVKNWMVESDTEDEDEDQLDVRLSSLFSLFIFPILAISSAFCIDYRIQLNRTKSMQYVR